MRNVFLESDDAVVTLVGLVLKPAEVQSDNLLALVATGEDTFYRLFDKQSVMLLDFLQMPRTKTEVLGFVSQVGEDESMLRKAVVAKRIVLSEDKSPWGVIDSFAGFKLFSNSEPVAWDEGRDGPRVDEVTMIANPVNDLLPPLPVSVFLASAMWHSEPGEDFPTFMHRTQPLTEFDYDEFAVEVLMWLPAVLGTGYGFFGTVDG